MPTSANAILLDSFHAQINKSGSFTPDGDAMHQSVRQHEDNQAQLSSVEESLMRADSSSAQSSEEGCQMGRSCSSTSLQSSSPKGKGIQRRQHFLLMTAAGALLVLSFCVGPQAAIIHSKIHVEPPDFHLGGPGRVTSPFADALSPVLA